MGKIWPIEMVLRVDEFMKKDIKFGNNRGTQNLNYICLKPHKKLLLNLRLPICIPPMAFQPQVELSQLRRRR
jgi:hypothetical protein